MLKKVGLFFMKSSDIILGFDSPSTESSSMTLPSKADLFRQVNAIQPFCRMQKSVIFPFLTIISSGWQILRLTSSARVSKLFLDKLFKKPKPSNSILLASFRY